MEKDTNSVLQMLDLFFSSISFKQKKEKTGELKLSINHSIDRQKIIMMIPYLESLLQQQ